MLLNGDFSSGRSSFKSSDMPPLVGGNKSPTGHSWLILESPEERIECGHTLNNAKRVTHYLRGILRREKQNHPNPGAYVWESFPGGKRHGRLYFFDPSFVLYLPISEIQHKAIASYIKNYDFKNFSMVNHECTHFVAGAARLATSAIHCASPVCRNSFLIL